MEQRPASLFSGFRTYPAEEVVRTVAAEAVDRVDPAVFAELGRVGDARALAALESAASLMKKLESLEPVYAAIGTLLATLNWLLAWCVSGLCVLTLRRIKTEERILIGLFGAQYLEYRQRVPALGPGPWRCLGFDKGAPP